MTTTCEVIRSAATCIHPEGHAGTPCRSRCHICGMRACRACSEIRPHPWVAGLPAVRVCNDCAEAYRENDDG